MTIKKYGTGLGTGWHLESERHALARRGIKTAHPKMLIDYAFSIKTSKERSDSIFNEYIVEGGDYRSFPLYSLSLKPYIEGVIERLEEQIDQKNAEIKALLMVNDSMVNDSLSARRLVKQ